ncbi:MAG TPA: efflux RND transporter periplasmic adaptor subunit [Vicinamibacteria bacterium]|nr:efflux RND transporter periplasmic adaptor subunit [Vicinamibacteria bacterium]
MSENARRESALESAAAGLKAAAAAATPWVRRPRTELLEAVRRIRANPRRAILPGGGLAIAALAAAFLLWRSPSSSLVAAAQKGSFEVKIVEGGTLQALRSVTYSSSIPGSQAKILEIVPEGTEVEVGDVLVKFDREPFAEELERSKAQLAQAEAELVKAEQELKLLQIAAQEELTESKDKLRLSELEMQSVIEGKGKLAEAESAAQLAQAERELAKAESSFEDLKPLLAEGFITKLELDRAQQAVDKAREDLELLRIKHKTYMDYTRPTEIEASRAALANSKEGLRTTERSGSYLLSQAEAALKLAESKHAELVSRVETGSQNLEQCEILATVGGLVIYKDVFFGSEKRKVQVGDQVWPNQPLIMLPDLSRMVVETQVRETDIYKVEKNQQVAISVDAYPELELRGRVDYIGTLAQEDQALSAGKYFTVTIVVDEVDRRLRPGMSARVELLVERLASAVYVPLEAVFERGGKHYCYLASGETREVLVGPSNENHIVIDTGVEAGEIVLLGDPSDEGRPLGGESVPGFLDVVAPPAESGAREP